MSSSDSQLFDLCTYAYENTAYYRKLFDSHHLYPDEICSIDNLRKIPLLTQDAFQKADGDFLSSEYTKYPKIDDVIIKRPIGTGGRCLKLMWDVNLLNHTMSNLSAFRTRHYGITLEMKSAAFFTSQYRSNKVLDIPPSRILRNDKNISFSRVNLTAERFRQCYEEILRFEPEILYLPPSIACQLAEMIKEAALPLPTSLKHIELSGEYLNEECREAIKETCKIDPVNVYTTKASGPIAMECREHQLHVLEDNVIVEVIKDGFSVIGREGAIYITVLNNRAMPLLRFETGDRGVLVNGKCSCGNAALVLRLTYARENDFILLPDGGKLNSYVIKNIIEFTNEYMSNSIKQFQVMQKDVNKFEIKISLKPAYAYWGQAVKENFISNAEKTLLARAEWDFDFTDDFNGESNKYFVGIKLADQR